MILPCILLASALLSQPEPEGRVDAFEGVVVDYDAKAVECTGVVPVDAHSEATPDVNIELVAESGGVRDHESLIRIDAEPRHVHAALLLLGLEPGSPGAILSDGTRLDPVGPELTVTVRYTVDGETIEESPTAWVRDRDSVKRLDDAGPRFVFGGSSERDFFGDKVYMAEAEGTVVGLCTFGVGEADDWFGAETVGMSPVYTPDSETGDPFWLADAERIPEQFTPVTLVLTIAETDEDGSVEPE